LEEFFIVTIFAISMDYTVFLFSAAKEHWVHTHDPNRRGWARLRTPDA
jgi:RND superfamily putative drug exporter